MKAATPETAPNKPRPDETNNADRLFVHLLAGGSRAEVDSGPLAGTRAQSPDVKAFGQEMVHDHGPVGERLDALARHAGVPLPAGLDPDHQAMRRELDDASGARFDALYLHGQLVEHQKTAQLLEWEIDSGQDMALQGLAADALPVVMDHLRRAQQLLSKATRAPPQGLAESNAGP